MINRIAGILIFLMVCLSIISDVSVEFICSRISWLPGLCGWLAAILLIRNVGVLQRWQSAVIAVTGLLFMLAAIRQGSPVDIGAAVGDNAKLISMIAAVGFLRLIILSADDARASLPVGPRAYYKTLFGVSLFGAVINISALVIFADRLVSSGRLNRITSQSLTRVFSGCSAWSPFFGGMAVVLTYVPGMKLSFVMMACFPFAVIGFLAVCLEARLRYHDDIRQFQGYPLKFSSLWVPASLAGIVIVLSQAAPHWSVLTRISLAALSLTIVVLVVRSGFATSLRILYGQITDYLPGMVNELVLFLVAGLLANGLAAVLAGDLIQIPVFDFHAFEALVLLAVMILFAMIGVHPVVTVAGATPVLMALEPDPDLLAVVYLVAWSLGTCASPLSGTHLLMQGRYGVPGWKGAGWNWPYVLFMFLIAIPLFYLVDRIV